MVRALLGAALAFLLLNSGELPETETTEDSFKIMQSMNILITIDRYEREQCLAAGIGCFKCVSVGGSMPACEDQFHNNKTNIVSITFFFFINTFTFDLTVRPLNFWATRHLATFSRTAKSTFYADAFSVVHWRNIMYCLYLNVPWF